MKKGMVRMLELVGGKELGPDAGQRHILGKENGDDVDYATEAFRYWVKAQAGGFMSYDIDDLTWEQCQLFQHFSSDGFDIKK